MAEIRTAHRQWARLEQLTTNGRDRNSSPSMGEIGTAHGQWRRLEQLTANGGDTNLRDLGRQKIFLRLHSNPVGGPPRIQAPSRKSRSFEIAIHNTRNGIRKRTGSPPKYLQAARACTAAGQYTNKVGLVSHLERTSGTSHAVTRGQQPQLGRLHKAIDHWVLDGTLAARTAPRAATSSVVLYRSSHTTGSYRDPHCSHCTSGSNELSGALS